MINKKILLSLFTIGLLACVASAGTWAYFQDTVTSSDNSISTATLTSQYMLDNSEWLPFTHNDGIFGPFNLSGYAVPGDTDKVVQTINIKNAGNTPAEVTAQIEANETAPSVPGLVINVGKAIIYQGGGFTSSPVDLGTAGASGDPTVDASIKYTYADNSSSQNAYEGQTIAFNMSIAEKAVQAP